VPEDAWKYYWSRREIAEKFGFGENLSNSKVEGEEIPISEIIPKSIFLLDAGSGSGRYVYHLNKKVSVYVCADLSREMLNVAKKRFGQLENVYFIRCDIEFLPFLNDTFDVTLCVSVLRHLPFKKGERVFKALTRVTKNLFFFTAYLTLNSEEPALNFVGDLGILDHAFKLETLKNWAHPFKIQREVRLLNEYYINRRYLFVVKKR